MTREEKIELLDRYLNGTCSDEEELLVLNWYKDIQKLNPVPENIDLKTPKKQVWDKLRVELPERRMYSKWIAAAAMVAVLCVPIVFLLKRPAMNKADLVAVQDISPGGNKAVLVLSDGSEISLNDARKGEIAQLPGVTVTKTDSGTITYQVKETTREDQSLSYNTIKTPRGGQYEVILPDGSKVVLNAESSLRYPTHFALNEREVQLEGEAYFDVQKNPQKPFIVVSSDRQRVMVRGTHFNVNCFLNQPIRTTLEEGKVEILLTNSSQTTTLKPGDQSIVTSKGIEVRRVNPRSVIAWKTGMFVFSNNNLKEVLEQISRWYDVTVDYSGIVADTGFEGEIPRNLSLLKVLEIINAYSKYKFTLIEGRRIVQK